MGQRKRDSQRRKCKKAGKAAGITRHLYHIQEIDCFFFFLTTPHSACERQGDVGFCKAVGFLLASGNKKARWWLCPIFVDLVEVRRAFGRSRLGNLRKFKAREQYVSLRIQTGEGVSPGGAPSRTQELRMACAGRVETKKLSSGKKTGTGSV